MESKVLSRFWRNRDLETPERLERVLLYRDVESGSFRHSDGSLPDPYGIGCFYSDSTADYEETFGRVTHWMPLPAAPDAADTDDAGDGMTAEREAKILEGAIAKWGVAKQTDKAIEEMAELTQAIMKLRLADSIKKTSPDSKERQHIREEMADVSIMLRQLELIYGGYADEEIQKLERLERMVQG